MKLRLVREDGTAARLEDLASAADVEIDGVLCAIAEYEGPDPKVMQNISTEIGGSICLRLDYANHRRDRYQHLAPGRTHIIPTFECPFARKARTRAAGGES